MHGLDRALLLARHERERLARGRGHRRDHRPPVRAARSGDRDEVIGARALAPRTLEIGAVRARPVDDVERGLPRHVRVGDPRFEEGGDGQGAHGPVR